MNELLLTHFAKACSHGGFLGFPTWYHYLDGVTDSKTGLCTPQLSGINDVWLIVAAILEILLRIAVLAAIGFIIFGAFQYLTSQGEPDKTTRARHTIINAVIGLVIAILSTAVINFIATRVS